MEEVRASPVARPETRLDIPDDYGCSTPLHYAYWHGCHEAIRLFRQDARCNPDLLNKDGSGEEIGTTTRVKLMVQVSALIYLNCFDRLERRSSPGPVSWGQDLNSQSTPSCRVEERGVREGSDYWVTAFLPCLPCRVLGSTGSKSATFVTCRGSNAATGTPCSPSLE